MKLDLNFKIPLINNKISFRVYPYYDLEDNVVGINSNLSNGFHIFMCDFDDVFKLEELKKELKEIIEREKFGDLEIYESSYKRYFVFGFYETLNYEDILKVTYRLNCCKNWKKWRMLREECTLRMTPKKGYKKNPTYVCTIKGKNKQIKEENKVLKEFVHNILDVEGEKIEN